MALATVDDNPIDPETNEPLFEEGDTDFVKQMKLLNLNGRAVWRSVHEHYRKEPRSYTLPEAARLIDRSPTTIRNAEKQGLIPAPDRDARNHRQYSLNEISHIRKSLGVNVGRRKGDELCVAAIATYKGGSAKTTTAVHLAHYLTERGYRVLLLDGDPQASATTFFELIPDMDLDTDDTLNPYLIPDYSQLNPLETDLRRIIRPTHWGDLEIVPTNLQLYMAEYKIPEEVHGGEKRAMSKRWYERLARAINSVESDYDVVVIDSPPSLGMLAILIMYANTGIFAPILPAQVDYASTLQYMSMLADVTKNVGAEPSFFHLLLSNAPSTKSALRIENLVRGVFEDFVLNAKVHRTAEIEKASEQFASIFELQGAISDTRTYNRAKNEMLAACSEMEQVIRATWPSHREEMNLPSEE